MRVSRISDVRYSPQVSVSGQEQSFTARFPNGLKKPRHIKPFYAYRDLVQYNPRKYNFGNYTIPVHNEGIGQHLKSAYSLKSFEELFSFAKKKGTFDFISDENGFVKTSFINRKENLLMSDLIWITDTCHNMELIKRYKPEKATKIFNKLTEFYEGQQKNFDEAIANPIKYRQNGFWPQETPCGVGHCFVPQTKQPHKWFAHTRLESAGNYLQAAVDMITSGFSGKKYGYKSAEEVPDKVVNAISNIVKYMKSINYPKARSCGAWEEQTFVNSLTSDTAVVNQGMRDVFGLMYAKTSDKNIQGIQNRILNSKHGDVFKDKKGLYDLLSEGEQRIIDHPDVETFKGFYNKKVQPWEEKCLSRDFDAAMSFMIQTEKLNSADVHKDSIKKLLILKRMGRSLVRDNGAIRYKGDEYLNLDYHNLKNPWTDNKHKNEAEWFLVSEISSAYGSILKNLLNNVANTKQMTQLDKKLIKIALNGQTEYINRSYARIAAKNSVKSNGYSNMSYKVPEAYEAITLKNGQVKYVSGAHPLTWAASSLHKASTLFADNLEKLEKLDIHN